MEVPEFLEEMLVRITKDALDKNLQNKAKAMLSDFRQERRVYLLRKALYGRQAGCQWYFKKVRLSFKLSMALKDAGLIPTNVDPCVYVNEEKTIFLLIYVDDISIASKSHKHKKDY